MKTLCLLFAASFLASLSPLLAQPVSTQITSATVYPDRAVVTRTAHVDLPAGESELRLEQLPASLLDQSLQVAGHGTAAATILDVNARVTFIAASPDPRVKTLEDQITATERKLRALNDRAALLEQQKALIVRIEGAVTAPPAKDSTAPRPSFDEWQKLLTFADENRSKLLAEQQSLDPQREEVKAALAALNEQLAQLRGQLGGGRSYKTVTVRLAASRAGSLDLRVSYAVPGASWMPSYDARLREDDGSIELAYFGVVRQNTGEDWKGVALTLSTARPNLGGGAPELPPWIVDVYVPAEYPKRAREEGMLKAARADARQQFNTLAASPAPSAGAVDKVEEQDAAMSVAAMESGATSASFKIATPATVLSDNSTQKVGITTTRLSTQLQYESTPRELETAFLSAYVTNTSDFPLLGGPVNTFLGDAFVATSSLKTVMPGEKFELALGADEGMAVKRKVLPRFSEDTGLTGKGRRVTYQYLITVSNNKKSAAHVVFKESIPVSRNEKIVVKLQTPAERDIGTPEQPKEVTREADGKLVWRIDLKPGEKREVPIKFAVEYPGDVTVTGLE